MLEVVEQDQELLPPEETGEVVARSDRLRYLRRQKFGVGEAGERDPENAVPERSDEQLPEQRRLSIGQNNRGHLTWIATRPMLARRRECQSDVEVADWPRQRRRPIGRRSQAWFSYTSTEPQRAT